MLWCLGRAMEKSLAGRSVINRAVDGKRKRKRLEVAWSIGERKSVALCCMKEVTTSMGKK